MVLLKPVAANKRDKFSNQNIQMNAWLIEESTLFDPHAIFPEWRWGRAAARGRG